MPIEENEIEAMASTEIGQTDERIEDDSVEDSIGFNRYSITSYGIDYDVDGIVRRFKRGDIEIPVFQRNYIWNKTQASRFIESLLLGLPVPGIFLYRQEGTEKMVVVDGQQRIRTLDYFFDEVFKDEKQFRLRGLETEFDGKMHRDLRDEDRRRLENAIIHATVMLQNTPDDDGSSKYFVFERLNTGGTQLVAQEIRTAIYGGNFCELLNELNRDSSWRELFGKVHTRQRDVELILRFFALYYDNEKYGSSMVGFLNKYMEKNRSVTEEQQLEMKRLFCSTTKTILERIGDRAFRLQTTLNAALLDSTMVGVTKRLEKGEICGSLKARHAKLLEDEEYLTSVTERTSRKERVNTRIKFAVDAFADAQ